MKMTKEQVVVIASQARKGLEKIYGNRMLGVYLFGSATRGDLNEDSDIDIAIVLDEIPDRFEEHERTSEFGSQISLDVGILVSFLFIPKADYTSGKYAIYRSIKREGIEI